MAEEQNRTLNDKFMLRLPDGMRDRIKAAAEANNRSMNAEIVAVLEREYPVPEPRDEIHEQYKRIVERLTHSISQAKDVQEKKRLAAEANEAIAALEGFSANFHYDEERDRIVNVMRVELAIPREYGALIGIGDIGPLVPPTPLGELIRDGYTRNNTTRGEVAEKTGIPAMFLVKLEIGDVEPTVSLLKKIGRVLKIDPMILLDAAPD